MISLQTWCLLSLSVLLLLSIDPTETEVVRSMSDCEGFLLNENPPQIPGILIDGKIMDKNRYKILCQTYKNQTRFVTLYDITNKVPVFSAYSFNHNCPSYYSFNYCCCHFEHQYIYDHSPNNYFFYKTPPQSNITANETTTTAPPQSNITADETTATAPPQSNVTTNKTTITVTVNDTITTFSTATESQTKLPRHPSSHIKLSTVKPQGHKIKEPVLEAEERSIGSSRTPQV
ncbi:hypothetical protein Q8A73_012756 [Channa argus]|nr:hypothetical protein Q8A73_012756 [Channa argus]